MRSIALGLDLQESFFDQKIDQRYHNLRLLSYPSIRTKLLSHEGQARAGAHSGILATCSLFGLMLLCIFRLWDYNLAIPGFSM